MFIRSRNGELVALFLLFSLFALGLWEIELVEESFAFPTRFFLTFVISFSVTHLFLRIRLPYADQILLPLVGFLSSVGLLVLLELNPRIAHAQEVWIVLALVTALILIFFKDYSFLVNYKYFFGTVGLLFLLAPILVGTERGGAKLWLTFFGYSFQPAEVAKILLVIFLAGYLEEKKELLKTATRPFLGFFIPEIRHFGPLLFVWGISLALLVFEKDLGSSLLFFSLFLTMLYIATGRLIYVVLGFFLFIGGTTAAYYSFSHVQERVDIWLNPLPFDVGGKVYQIAQSLFSLSAGGLSGTGLAQGYLGRQIFMPAVYSDFLFSVIGEELGLAGSLALILAYILFLSRGFFLALKARDEFSKLLISGLVAVLGLQSLIIMGGILKVIPLTGITLPFVSYGGSSMLANFILLVILLSLSNSLGETAKLKLKRPVGGVRTFNTTTL